MIDNVMKMNIEEFRQQVKELSVEQHLLLSGWVYGFTDQAHKKIHDLLADEKPLPVDFKGEVILYTNPSPAQKGGIIGSVGPATASSGFLPAGADEFRCHRHHRKGRAFPRGL